MTEEISLGECPCGEPANWYRVEAPSPASAVERAKSSAIRSIGLDEAVPGWKCVDVLRRQSFAGEENQAARYDDDYQVGPDADDW